MHWAVGAPTPLTGDCHTNRHGAASQSATKAHAQLPMRPSTHAIVAGLHPYPTSQPARVSTKMHAWPAVRPERLGDTRAWARRYLLRLAGDSLYHRVKILGQ